MYRNPVLVLILICFSTMTAFAYAAEKKEDAILKRAWNEYKFQEFKKAKKLFEDAEQNPANKEELFQALVGQAFCLQFGQKNSVTADDYRKAVALYERCLSEAEPNHRLILFWKAMKAECLYKISVFESEQEKLSEAEELWKEIESTDKTNIFAQDAALSKAVMQSTDVNLPKVTAYCTEMEQYISPYVTGVKKIDSTGTDKAFILAPVMANYIFNIYYWRGDYMKSLDYLVSYCRFGPTSFQYKATAYFKAARIADKLGDKATAIEYYKKLSTECKSDSRSFFSRTRVNILNSEGGPQVPPKTEGARN